MPRYDLVILDFDGTIADTLDEITVAVGHAFREFGRPAPSRERVSDAIGHGLRRTLLGCAPDLSESELVALSASYRAHYDTNADRLTRLFPGAREFLDAARAAGVTLAILSNKDEATMLRGACHLGVTDAFAVALGALDGRPRKPDPTIYGDFIVPHVGPIPVDRVLMVGDDVPDLRFAENLGCDAAWARYGFNQPEACAARNPRYTIDSFAELSEIVLGAPGGEAPAL